MRHACTLLFLLALLTTAASADTFSFSFTANDYSGSGIFQATLNGTPGQYLINAVFGSVDTGNGTLRTISALLPVAPDLNSFESNDNILFYPSRVTGNFFDRFGVSFALANGAEVNLFNSASFLMRANGNVVQEKAIISVLATPEPSPILLLATGLFIGITILKLQFRGIGLPVLK